MALQVWLPLTGDINNNGIMSVPITTNSSFVKGGLFGKMYESTADNKYVKLDGIMNKLKNFKQYSMAAWVFVSKAATNHSSSIISSGDWNVGSKQMTFGLYGWNASRNGYNYILYPNRTSWNRTITIDTFIEVNKWYHIAITYDGEKTRAYVNGEHKASVSDGGITIDPGNVSAYVGCATYYAGFTLRGNLNDVRIYDHCLSVKEIKEISRPLLLHYKMCNREPVINLIPNSTGKNGIDGWSTSSYITDVPPNTDAVYAFGPGSISKDYIPYNPLWDYRFEVWLKTTGPNSTTVATYPSLFPYDVDKNFINYYNSEAGFAKQTVTKLTRDLKNGDTIGYFEDLSQWITSTTNHYFHIALFGYADSTGYVYPDLIYTRNTIKFGSVEDKSNIDKTNNTIKFLQPWNGKTIPAGTTVCQSTEGSTYFYPLGQILTSNIQNWKFYSNAIIKNQTRLKAARYVKYYSYPNSYDANMVLSPNFNTHTSEYDCSGNGYDGTYTGTNGSVKSPRYDNAVTFPMSTSYLKLPAITFTTIKDSYSFSWWSKIQNMSNKMAWGFSDGNRLNVYPSTAFCWNTGDGSSNRFKYDDGTDILFTPYNNAWHHYVVTGDGTTTRLYIDGEYVGKASVYKPLTGTIIIISGWDTGGSYKWTDGSISDFRIYGKTLSDAEIQDLYSTCAAVDLHGNVYGYEFNEVDQ